VNRIIRACAAGLAASLLAGSMFSAMTATEQLPTEFPGVSRRIARGATHQYRVTLSGNTFLELVVEQRGVDLLVQTRDSAGRDIAEFDDRAGSDGQERASIVADVDGVYTFGVTTSPLATDGGAYSIRIESRRPATDADRVWQQSRRLRTEAARLSRAGRFSEARPLVDGALSASLNVRGPGDRDVALLNLQLADNALARRDDAGARMLAERAAAIFDAEGPDELYSVRTKSLLAIVHQHAGERSEAEALLDAARAGVERRLSPAHPWYVECLTTEANLRLDAGDYDGAEALDRRAMAILERAGTSGGTAYSALLHNLAEVDRQHGDILGAEQLLLHALAIEEQVEGPRSYRVTTTLQNLAITARARGDYRQALDFDTRALFMREALVGPVHAEIAPLLNNLAVLYRSMGDEAHARPMLFRALAIREATVGPYHRGTLNTVGNIARSYTISGDIPRAIEYERRADAIVEQQLALNLAIGSERQKIAFVRSVAERSDRTISLHLRQAPHDPEAAALATLVVLQRKGRAQDAMADVFAAVRGRTVRSVDRADLDRLNDVRRRFAERALGGAPGVAAAANREALTSLQAEAERLESSLSAHSGEFRAQAQPISVAAVQAALPADTALIEYAVFRPFHPEASTASAEYDPAHFAAYVLRRGRPAIGVDLGKAAPIDAAVSSLRDLLRDSASPEAEVQARAARVFDLVMRPLEPLLEAAARIVISPDGSLQFLPFEALVGPDDRYLIEHVAVSYVTSGRDLLRLRVPREPATAPVVVADPAFGDAPPSAGRVYFTRLAGSDSEARTIKGLFPEARLLTGAAANKVNLRQIRAPRILHIASHAFFADADAPIAAQGNPLLRSGIALAGVNRLPDGRAAGVLTALEASGLNLWGTALVTLSACDSGVGEVRNGEGVYGLRRAFVLAGAQTLVMSLWPVSDYVARDTMVAYYNALRKGAGRGDGLREVKLAMLKRASRRHPYYWAAFIQSGAWTPLGDATASGEERSR
jgi:CHAT domain-containing protein